MVATPYHHSMQYRSLPSSEDWQVKNDEKMQSGMQEKIGEEGQTLKKDTFLVKKML